MNESNSGISPAEKTLIELTLNTRKPMTEAEEQLLKEIEEIEKKGRIVEIPFDIF